MVAFLTVITFQAPYCRRTALLSAVVDPWLQTRQQATIQDTYSRLSLFIAASFLLLACSSDSVAANIQMGIWAQATRKAYPPMIYYLFPKWSVALPSMGTCLAMQFHFQTHEGSVTSGEWWDCKLQTKPIMWPTSCHQQKQQPAIHLGWGGVQGRPQHSTFEAIMWRSTGLDPAALDFLSNQQQQKGNSKKVNSKRKIWSVSFFCKCFQTQRFYQTDLN